MGESRERARKDSRQEIAEFEAEFLSTVAHALRAPLGTIVSYSELIAEERDWLSPDAAGFLDVVQRAAGQLTRLVADLVLLSQADAGALRPQPQRVQAGETVAEAVRAAAGAAEQAGVTLAADTGPGPPVRADPAQLRQALDYLIGNAIRFTPAGGSVRVAASQAGPEWRAVVTDTGIGIPENELSQVFDRYFRSSSTRSAGQPGAGLGLAVVRTLAGLQGGRVAAASGSGGGSRFSLWLPLADGHGQPAADGEGSRAAAGGEGR
jgi:signal transduction histidine kinase